MTVTEVVGVALGEGDRQALERFHQEENLRSSTRIEDHRRSGKLFLQAVAGSYAAVCIRLHAAVWPVVSGIPTLLLAYQSKCQDFMSSMGAEKLVMPMTESITPAAIEEQFRRILADSAIGPKLHGQALFWKRKQQEYYQRLCLAIRQERS